MIVVLFVLLWHQVRIMWWCIDYVDGESRIEIEDKDEGILHLSDNEGNDTDDNDL